MNLYWCALIGLALTAAMIIITEYYTATEYSPIGGAGIHHRSRDQYHRGPRGPNEVGAPGPCSGAGDLRRLPARRPVRHRHRGHRDAVDDRHDCRARRLRSDHRRRRRHRGDGRVAEGRTQNYRCARCGGQHRQGRDQEVTRSARRVLPPSCTIRGLHAQSRGAGKEVLELSDPAVIIGLFIGGLVHTCSAPWRWKRSAALPARWSRKCAAVSARSRASWKARKA